jgi:hypothetical protein
MSRSLLFACCACLVSGCILSIDGYRPDWDQDLATALLGTWDLEPADDPTTATVTVGDGGVLAIDYIDKSGKRGRFEAIVGRLGEHTVLDVWPVAFDDAVSDDYAAALIPGHILFVVELAGDEFVMHPIDSDLLESDLKSGTLTLSYVNADQGDVILTADSDDLNAAFATYLSRPGVFGDDETGPAVWRRRGGP